MAQTTVRRSKGSAQRKPPSRERYEESHPTVSCRVPRDVYERMEELRNSEDMSFADILKVGLGKLEPKAQQTAKARKIGYGEGYDDAASRFRVTYPCNVCGKPIAVQSDEAKQLIASFMNREGWGHGACHEKRGKGLA
ncbi:MAG: hypothetical protein Q8O40_01145 [Chloroflexota bacterium]|nr:hypothetical protein [Chloroflexota bacterium]